MFKQGCFTAYIIYTLEHIGDSVILVGEMVKRPDQLAISIAISGSFSGFYMNLCCVVPFCGFYHGDCLTRVLFQKGLRDWVSQKKEEEKKGS